MKRYLILFACGSMVSALYMATELREAFTDYDVLIGVAFIASLFVAGSAFSEKEGKHKFILQYGALVIFGAYGMLCFKTLSVIKLIIMITAMAIHIAYWNNSVQSREHRASDFKATYAWAFPLTSQFFVSLRVVGLPDLADQFLVAVCNRTVPDEAFWKQVPPQFHEFGQQVRQELNEQFAAQIAQHDDTVNS